MLRVTVELWPGGRESGGHVIATADIGRVRDGAQADSLTALEHRATGVIHRQAPASRKAAFPFHQGRLEADVAHRR